MGAAVPDRERDEPGVDRSVDGRERFEAGRGVRGPGVEPASVFIAVVCGFESDRYCVAAQRCGAGRTQGAGLVTRFVVVGDSCRTELYWEVG